MSIKRQSVPTCTAEIIVETNKILKNVCQVLRRNGHIKNTYKKAFNFKSVSIKFLKYQNKIVKFWKNCCLPMKAKLNIYGCDGRGKV